MFSGDSVSKRSTILVHLDPRCTNCNCNGSSVFFSVFVFSEFVSV